ncbi:MAG TPA: class I SAM-dependent rRNA methyltransferase [Aggregicoccus sp.]|nr:class I SAM-dependent rRNA methyltransferase [Aggregicoccus sp.]
MSAGLPAALTQRLREARERRGPLLADPRTSALRLLHGEADGVPEVTADAFGDLVVLSLYRDLSAQEEQQLADAAVQAWAPRSLYLKRRPREARVVANTRKEQLAPELPVRGEALSELQALERGLRFLIRPAQGLSVGLYLDMRDTRTWLREQVAGRTVLNLFAYTCAFGVAAHAGCAARVLNVDASRRVLEWGEENARLNGQAVDRYDYVAGDVFDWLERLAKKGERFDVVVCDPPSFATTRTSRFSAARDYAALAGSAARVVAPGGRLVACCNHAGLDARRFEAQVRQGAAQAGREARAVASLGPSLLDFPVTPTAPAALKVRVVELP